MHRSCWSTVGLLYVRRLPYRWICVSCISLVTERWVFTLFVAVAVECVMRECSRGLVHRRVRSCVLADAWAWYYDHKLRSVMMMTMNSADTQTAACACVMSCARALVVRSLARGVTTTGLTVQRICCACCRRFHFRCNRKQVLIRRTDARFRAGRKHAYKRAHLRTAKLVFQPEGSMSQARLIAINCVCMLWAYTCITVCQREIGDTHLMVGWLWLCIIKWICNGIGTVTFPCSILYMLQD